MTYAVMMAAAPFIDFRGQAFFVFLILGKLSPYILVELALWAAFVIASITVVRRAYIDGTASKQACLVPVLLIIPLVVNPWLVLTHIGWMNGTVGSGAFYSNLTDISTIVLFVAILGILIGVPIRSLIIGIVHLRYRRWRNALQSLAVVGMGYAFYAAGREANDRLTVQWCSSTPYRTLGKGIAVCPLMSILTFPEYIVRSTTTISQDDLVRRVAKGLNEEHCYFSPRRIARDYYWVNESC